MLWVRFVEHNTNIGPGFWITFSNPPKYAIGYCKNEAVFEVPIPDSSKYRIWTFKKQNKILQLLCNNVLIDALQMDEDTACIEMWSYNLTQVRLVRHGQSDPNRSDTASDYMRKYEEGTIIISLFSCRIG